MATIFALSTGYIKSAIAIVRVSGSNALESLSNITGQANISIKTHKPTLKKIYNYNNQAIDEAMIIYFAAPNSYTGEDLIEYHIHGSLGVIKELMATLAKQNNHRPALPGEFTKLALLNNKINLLKAEAINDLINSNTFSQIQQSIFHLNNAALDGYTNYQNKIKQILALCEASIDFSDQEIPDDLFKQVEQEILSLLTDIQVQQNKLSGVKKLKEGLKLAILGKPNVGKSSLINLITQRDTAIVSDIAGTTRDVIEVDLDFNGYQINIADTAGIRVTNDTLENEGVRRAMLKATKCDIKVAVFDANNINQDDDIIWNMLNKDDIIVINKIDLLKSPDTISLNNLLPEKYTKYQNIIFVSLNNQTNINNLLNLLQTTIQNIYGNIENPIIVNERQFSIITQIKDNLQNAIAIKSDMVLVAFSLRQALNGLDSIMGKTNTEQILDIIFSSFCIGK